MPLRFFLPPYVLGLCAIALAVVTRRHHREALRAAELASAYAAARMAMLSAQLQPHFLFNSLHAISVLIDESPRQASAMLARLGDFLRHALESSHWPWVDVATELAGLEAYLAVQQTRFSDRLSISIDASPESLGVCVPSLLLQPLAENAIEHGRNDSGSVLHVRVAVSVVAERLCIAVNNSRPQLRTDLSPADYGHGLSNVELRLRAAYGADARLTIGPDPQGGTSAFSICRCASLPRRGGAGGAPVNGAISTLVVDDEPLARKRVLRLLRGDPDINVVGTFSSATEAAAQAREHAPQLMLLDIRMPELDGFELVAALAESGVNPYVIFVTAYSDRSMDAFGVGAIDYLLKPFDDERFARAVARAKSLIASAQEPGRRAAPRAPRSPRGARACCCRSAARWWCWRCATSSSCRRRRST